MMANEDTGIQKKEPKKVATKKPKNKFLGAVTSIPKRMWRSILNSLAELKKVTWPGRKDLINYTTIVLVFMVMMALVVGLLDLGASGLVSLMIRR